MNHRFLAGLLPSIMVSVFLLSLALLVVSGEAAVSKDPAGDPRVSGTDEYVLFRIRTDLGEIHVLLDALKAPVSSANFARYAYQSAFVGTLFHRVVAGFIIQGGGFAVDGSPRASLDPIAYEGENGLSNRQYTLGVARTQAAGSGTRQFYVNLADNPRLNHQPDRPGYAVFGVVIDGRSVVDAIGRVKTSPGRLGEAMPESPIRILSVVRMNPADLSDVGRAAADEWWSANHGTRLFAASPGRTIRGFDFGEDRMELAAVQMQATVRHVYGSGLLPNTQILREVYEHGCLVVVEQPTEDAEFAALLATRGISVEKLRNAAVSALENAGVRVFADEQQALAASPAFFVFYLRLQCVPPAGGLRDESQFVPFSFDAEFSQTVRLLQIPSAIVVHATLYQTGTVTGMAPFGQLSSVLIPAVEAFLRDEVQAAVEKSAGEGPLQSVVQGTGE